MRVLLLDIDTLRPDHMGCYGYHRNTTPNMDIIAQEGVRFENCYCSDAPCLPSRAALVSGQFGIINGAVGHGGITADRRLTGENRGFRDITDNENFFNLFRKAGMHTVSISTFAERHSSWWFNAGFHELYNVGKKGNESGEEVLPIALRWLENNGKNDNWMMHLNLWDAHTPYRAPEEFGNPFEDEPLNTWIDNDVLNHHLKHVGPHSINEINMYNDRENPAYPRHPGSAKDEAGLKRIIDGYDCGIRYADTLLGEVFDLLRRQGIYDETAVIILSDHGENIGELGIYAEHATADNFTCHIPMIVKWPGGKQGHVAKGFHYTLDLVPTVAEMLGLSISSRWSGESYAKTLTEGAQVGREYLVLSQMAHVCQRSVRFGDWLYCRTYHDGFHLFDDEMLFNLAIDPHEQDNVKDEYPQICERAVRMLLDWHDDAMRKSPSVVDPLWAILSEGGPYHTRGHLEKYLKRLEATGRSEGAQKLREKYIK